MNATWEKFDDILTQLWDFFVPPIISFSIFLLIFYNHFQMIISNLVERAIKIDPKSDDTSSTKPNINPTSQTPDESDKIDVSVNSGKGFMEILLDLVNTPITKGESGELEYHFEILLRFASNILIDASIAAIISALVFIFVIDRTIRIVSLMTQFKIKADQNQIIRRSVSRNIISSAKLTFESPPTEPRDIRDAVSVYLDDKEFIGDYKSHRKKYLERMRRHQLLFSYVVSFIIIYFSMLIFDYYFEYNKRPGLIFAIFFFTSSLILAFVSVFYFRKSLKSLIRLEFNTYLHIKRQKSKGITGSFGTLAGNSGVYLEVFGFRLSGVPFMSRKKR